MPSYLGAGRDGRHAACAPAAADSDGGTAGVHPGGSMRAGRGGGRRRHRPEMALFHRYRGRRRGRCRHGLRSRAAPGPTGHQVAARAGQPPSAFGCAAREWSRECRGRARTDWRPGTRGRSWQGITAGLDLARGTCALCWDRYAYHTRLHVGADRAARVSVVLLYLAGARGLLLLALAFVVSGIASFVLLSRQRDIMSGALMAHLKNGRARVTSFRARLEEGTRAEDED